MLERCASVLICLAMSSGLLLNPQAPGVSIKENEVFLKTPSGRVRQLTNDSNPKYHARLSPNERLVVYHGDAIWKDGAQHYTLTLLHVDERNEAKHLLLANGTGEIEDVEWLSDDLFAVLGKGGRGSFVYTIFDVRTETMLQDLTGYEFRLSPDRSKLVFLDLIPGMSSEEWLSHYVMLYDISSNKTISDREAKDQILYPRREKRPFADLDDRHWVLSPLLWSPDSQSIAFIERHRKATWAIVLDIEGERNERVSKIRRYELANEEKVRVREIDSIAWEGRERLVITSTQGVWDSVNQMERVGPKVRWRIDLQTGEVSMRELSEPRN